MDELTKVIVKINQSVNQCLLSSSSFITPIAAD